MRSTPEDVYKRQAYAIPGLLVAVMLLVLFAGGSYWKIFPLRGLTSDNFADLSMIGKRCV